LTKPLIFKLKIFGDPISRDCHVQAAARCLDPFGASSHEAKAAALALRGSRVQLRQFVAAAERDLYGTRQDAIAEIWGGDERRVRRDAAPGVNSGFASARGRGSYSAIRSPKACQPVGAIEAMCRKPMPSGKTSNLLAESSASLRRGGGIGHLLRQAA